MVALTVMVENISSVLRPIHLQVYRSCANICHRTSHTMLAVKFGLVLIFTFIAMVENVSSGKVLYNQCVGRVCRRPGDPLCGPFCDCNRVPRGLRCTIRFMNRPG
ncbi:hypothetical protein MTO96_022470 [Rhipicephalus appendiculatus]